MYQKLIQKYNRQAPRYTSYPTALHFKELEGREKTALFLEKRNKQPRELSLYIHIPFCSSLCWYCGCTKVITRNPESSKAYMKRLLLEMDMLSRSLHKDSSIKHIHMGGGTPTFLTPDELRSLGKNISNLFALDPDAAFDIETDPRTITEKHVSAMADIGCNRVSIGIQDIYEDTQKAINRIQPMELNTKIVHWFREAGIRHLNVDLVYGLPYQTVERFKHTLEEVCTIDPNRFAIFNYAHVPWMMSSQKLLERHAMPDAAEKFNILYDASEYLSRSGYCPIGMDHFAKEEDELALAMLNGTLQRNFQGYSTRANLDIYGLGMSSISQTGNAYIQNVKDLDTYYDILDTGQWPHWKACFLTREDEIRRYAIMRLMCNLTIDFDDISRKWNIDARHFFQSSSESLDEMMNDGLLVLEENGWQVTTLGRFFLRNIASTLDQYLNDPKNNTRYSKTI
ncbi:oxygen-independent coproporphyrinogen III oxidase [Balneolaceae bacterium ANBcel3]|nr:oxygen-independent coproporphyrinogen III oxidase [Balneolaceae bacterium ANBcel3]